MGLMDLKEVTSTQNQCQADTKGPQQLQKLQNHRGFRIQLNEPICVTQSPNMFTGHQQNPPSIQVDKRLLNYLYVRAKIDLTDYILCVDINR